MNLLRTLDETVLPRLARGLGRIAGALRRVGRDPLGARPVLVGAAVLALVAFGATVATVRARPAPRDHNTGDNTGDVVRVGASDGDQVPAYLAKSRSELAALATARAAETHALVSFGSYVEPAVLAGLLADVTTVRVYARVPLPDVQTEIVAFPVNTLAVDVPAAMKRTADRKERAAAKSDRSGAGLSGNGERETQLSTFYQADARVSRAEAAAYRRLCRCVYGAVVKASPATLRELAARDGVRVVDPAPEIRRLDRTVFLPLRPEQISVVTPPSDGALPPTR